MAKAKRLWASAAESGILKADRGTLVVSLLLGVMIWFYVDSKRVEERSFTVPLECVVTEGWLLDSETLPRTVRLTVRGPSWPVSSLTPEELRVRRRITGASEYPDDYEASRELRAEDVVGLPLEVGVAKIEPERVQVRMLRLEKTYLPVEVDVIGEPEDGYQVRSVQVEPMRVPVEAPRGRINPSDVIRTAPMDVTSARGAVVRTLGLLPFDRGEFHYEPNQSVYVTVEVAEKAARRAMEKVPVRLLVQSGEEINKGYLLQPAQVTLQLEGPSKLLKALKPSDVDVFVSLRDRVQLTKDTFTVVCRSIVPAGVQVLKIEPADLRWAPAPQPARPAAGAGEPELKSNKKPPALGDASKTGQKGNAS